MIDPTRAAIARPFVLLLCLGLSTGCECGNSLNPDGDDAGPSDAAPQDATLDAPVDAFVCPSERACLTGRLCCAEGEECVDDVYCSPVCENVRCGDNRSVCCQAAQVCLDEVVCAADCAEEQELCGEDLDVCCDVGDACLHNLCVTPGDVCGDDFDCLIEGDYCELTIGRCLPIPDVDPVCEILPDFDAVQLEVEWHWPGVMVDGRLYANVIASPAVGDVSGDGVPDVVVPVYHSSSTTDTILVALHGGTGELLWRIGPGADKPDWLSPVALGNIDPTDDALEVVYHLDSRGARIVDGDGVTELGRRTTGGAGALVAAPSLADIDGDGVPDLIVGCHAMNGLDISDPAMDFFDAGSCAESSQSFAESSVADLDGDGELEVTSGGVAVQRGATAAEQILWERSGRPNGLTAVADLDLDAEGRPEVIFVRSGRIEVLDGATGAVLLGEGGSWQDATFSIPGGGVGGAPTVADFDADGMPEVATAGRGHYAVYDPDCLETPPATRAGGDCEPGTTDFLRWAAPTQDISSSVTGSSVFDFQGDGVAEVVYNDECFLHIFDGRDGTEILADPRPNSSRTGLEYPLVVDVDRDGNSEIVVPANNDQIGRDNCPEAYRDTFGVPISELPDEYRNGTQGIFVYGDPADRWVRTRPIWNQYSYHVTNVDDLGGIPVDELDNWTEPGLNNYRQNVQGAGVFNAPNLVGELDAVASCADGSVRLSVVVTNAGSRGVAPGVRVEVVQLLPAPETAVGVTMTTRALLPGQSERLTLTATDVDYDVDLTFEVRINGAGDAAPAPECNAEDNTDQATEMCISFG